MLWQYLFGKPRSILFKAISISLSLSVSLNLNISVFLCGPPQIAPGSREDPHAQHEDCPSVLWVPPGVGCQSGHPGTSSAGPLSPHRICAAHRYNRSKCNFVLFFVSFNVPPLYLFSTFLLIYPFFCISISIFVDCCVFIQHNSLFFIPIFLLSISPHKLRISIIIRSQFLFYLLLLPNICYMPCRRHYFCLVTHYPVVVVVLTLRLRGF